MFIFIFYCICKKDAREVICSCVNKQKKGITNANYKNQ
uniref:Uncharacterized protein n=1 Tax=Octopus bimaculoides TaxID=37653 RepID=A0A0L8FM75_OCTBM